jgi:hypothetical protein
MEQYYTLLVQINEYARMNDEDRMHATISELDDGHVCCTIGITEYIFKVIDIKN